MKAWFQSIRRCRNAQDLKCFGKKKTKKKRKEKRKKERKKKGKAPRLGFESSSTCSGLTNLCCQLHKLWVVSSFPHAQGFAWRANVCSFSFSFFFFFVSLHLRRTSPKGKGLLVVYQRQKCFLKHENHALSRARVWRHGKGNNNTIPSPPSYSQSLVLIPFIMLEGFKGVLRSTVFGQFTVSSFLYN